jgi:hypothetical protein
MIYLGNLELPRSPENNLYLALLHYEDLFTQDHSWLKSLKHWVGEENIMPVPAAALVNTDPVDQKAILLAVVVFFYYQISSADFRDEEVFAQVDRIFRAEQLNHKKELRDMAKENEPQMCPKVKKEEPQMCPEVKEEEPQMCPEVKKEEHQMSPAVKNLIIRLLDKA